MLSKIDYYISQSIEVHRYLMIRIKFINVLRMQKMHNILTRLYDILTQNIFGIVYN